MWELIRYDSVDFAYSKSTHTTYKNIVRLKKYFKIIFLYIC